MKNTVIMNIGYTRNDGGTNTPTTVAAALRHRGFILTYCRLVCGEWQGRPEMSLACEALAALPLCHAECKLAIKASIQHLASDLGQDCIAVQWPEGHGELVPDVGEFDHKQFHSPRCVDLGPSFL